MKKSFLICTLLFVNLYLFSQNTLQPTDISAVSVEQTTQENTQTQQSTHQPKAKAILQNKLSLFANLGENIQYNSAPLPSSPSPCLFTPGIGLMLDFVQFPLQKCSFSFSFEPALQFSCTYYLWQDSSALPSSPENRTALVPSLLLDTPLCINLNFGRHSLSAGFGLALYSRVAFLASKVPASEKQTITFMNKYFWSSGRYFYPSFNASYNYYFADGSSFGLCVKGFLPVSNFFTENNYAALQNGILSLSARFAFNIPLKKN